MLSNLPIIKKLPDMKHYFKSLLLAALAVSVTACEIDELNTNGTGTETEEVGYLKIGNVSVNLDTEHAATNSEPKAATRAVTAQPSAWPPAP